MNINLILADDDPLIREALEIVLNKDQEINVVGIAKNGLEAVELCKTKKVDIALLDIRMPELNGVEAVKEITKCSEARAIMLTTFDEDDLVSQAIQNGAKGYLLKGKSTEEIKNAIKMVHLGNTVFQESVFKSINTKKREKLDLSELTEREVEVVKLIAEGLTNKEIAERIFLSEGTIKNYISNILNKLDLKQRTQIAIKYLQSI